MRSRYSAYSLGGYGAYLLENLVCANGQRPVSRGPVSSSDTEWLGLQVLWILVR